MNTETTAIGEVLEAVQYRLRERDMLKALSRMLDAEGQGLEEALKSVIAKIPEGWQYPRFSQARIALRDREIAPPGFQETAWSMSEPITVRGEEIGRVHVQYTHKMPDAEDGPFLETERRLLSSVARLISQTILGLDAPPAGRGKAPPESLSEMPDPKEYLKIPELLESGNPALFRQVSRKLLNHLAVSGVAEAKELLLSLPSGLQPGDSEAPEDNRPSRRAEAEELDAAAKRTWVLAWGAVPEEELLGLVEVWLKEERVHFLVQALEGADTSLLGIAQAMERYRQTGIRADELSKATQAGLTTALVRRLLTDNVDFIETARHFVEIDDFFDLLSHSILLPKSYGKLGGKCSGIFLAAQIICRGRRTGNPVGEIRIPKTWYIPSDVLLQFLAYNKLDHVYNWKYLDLDQIRQEYPHMLQVFKGSRFPPEVVSQLSAALEDFGERPVIVRSSSLLEDRMGSAFSGKYKSLFLANQGDQEARVAALLDAIAEVYASVFSPDPIQYRAERGLLDQHEEMGVMIQEVVGQKVGRYFLPAFSGVGFSNNEFRWSPRIKREDGLLRLVPGLGTRAVDRLADDYPVLVAPGQPRLRVNVTPEETARYSPKKIDVINLDENAFETIDIADLLRQVGRDYPDLFNLTSIHEDDRLRMPSFLDIDAAGDRIVFTFEGLITRTPFVSRMRDLLALLRESLGSPADIEFACDGRDFYLLQCRPQSYSEESLPSPIPRDIPEDRIVFSANRYISNARCPDITHIVYVDPDGYSGLTDLAQLRDVGRAISRLNKILPKRRFILMGPGRWGSRGDIKLGVNVTYSDISNTAILVEIARKRGNYVPDLSFGTHFFQDLVESSIRYLPLYPDDPGILFQEAFLTGTPGILGELLPEFADLSETIRVIDVPKATGGRVLRVLMNADLDEALGILAEPGEAAEAAAPRPDPIARSIEDHSKWRMRMAERIAREINPKRFGVKAIYVFGSTRNGTAGPTADIDLLIHFDGTDEMRSALQWWLEGWSLCLSEVNFLRTGYQTTGLLDVRLVRDEEIRAQIGFAAKIGAVTDAAQPLPMRQFRGQVLK